MDTTQPSIPHCPKKMAELLEYFRTCTGHAYLYNHIMWVLYQDGEHMVAHNDHAENRAPRCGIVRESPITALALGLSRPTPITRRWFASRYMGPLCRLCSCSSEVRGLDEFCAIMGALPLSSSSASLVLSQAVWHLSKFRQLLQHVQLPFGCPAVVMISPKSQGAGVICFARNIVCGQT
jgi:hypothetical protein